MVRAFRIVSLVVSLALCLSWSAIAQQGVGSIGGTITDASGGVLPGAAVTLSSPGLIGGNQETVTDERGAYQFTRLVPGTYSVTAELSGFSRAVQPNVVVNANATARADLKLATGALEESITVTGASPLLDTTSAVHQTVMSRDVLDTLPTGADIWSIARTAPAVTISKIDVGGKEMIAQSVAYVHGSTSTENSYLMDGMEINHYSTGTGQAVNYYVDTFQAEQLNYQAGQAPAEQAVGGVIVSLITKTGTNKFRLAAMYDGTSQSLQANNLTPTLRQQLLAGVPPAALAANPDIVPGGEIALLFDSAATLSGPILKDRLWFFAHTKFGKSNQYKVGSYNADGSQLLSDNTLADGLGKVSWAVTRSNQLHYFFTKQLKGRYHVAGGPTVTQFFDTKASAYNPSKNVINMARWTSVLSSRMVLDVAGITMNGQTNNLPQPDVTPGDIPRFDSATNTNTVASANYSINNGWRAEAASSLSYSAGTHELKLGYQLVQTRSVSGATSVSNPQGFRAVYRNGVPDSVNAYNTPTSSIRRHRDHAVYLQDKWRPAQKLTLNLGVRYQSTYGWIDGPLCQQATDFISQRCFPDVTGVPDWKSLVPRASAIYDVSGDGKTALKFSANRYIIPQGVIVVARVNPIGLTSDKRAWTVCAPGQTSGCDLNRDLIPQLNELGPSTGFNLGTTNRYADNLKWPVVNEISTEIERQLPGSLVVSLGYYYRGQRNMIGSRNVAVPTSGYIPLQVTEASSGRQVTVYNQDPATLGKFDVLWSNEPELNRSFNGVDVTAQKRMSNKWMAMGSLSWGKSDDFIYADTADLNNPNNAFRRGPDPFDRPLFAKMSGAYELPYGMTVAGTGQYFTGWPITTTVLVSGNTARLTQVSQSLVVEPSGTQRLPNITMFDMNLKKTLRVGAVRIDPRVDVFNVFNVAGITSETTQLGPSYGSAIEIIGGRLIKFGANLNW